ncbi:hypothetical protein GWI33_001868 [Rhynchophorus ferrugineus]|uniref:Uncharacterized protein n=1 Tax=Rhynchophorus ferrugineus TaxID=354439 RepID=A0A834HS30_RHYFE|nr:hypothetical protein GWI33_001990 [Rhynchophorus ferrugineus]KAF7263565.1 hypothetical protein GWI33_001868 [Rhynchophorus ferrugineus]
MAPRKTTLYEKLLAVQQIQQGAPFKIISKANNIPLTSLRRYVKDSRTLIQKSMYILNMHTENLTNPVTINDIMEKIMPRTVTSRQEASLPMTAGEIIHDDKGAVMEYLALNRVPALLETPVDSEEEAAVTTAASKTVPQITEFNPCDFLEIVINELPATLEVAAASTNSGVFKGGPVPRNDATTDKVVSRDNAISNGRCLLRYLNDSDISTSRKALYGTIISNLLHKLETQS